MSARRASARRPSATPEDILRPCTPRVRAAMEALRALVRETIPTAEERAYPGWKALGYRDAQAGYFCGLFPRADRVHVLFEHGVALPDPDALLTGDGRQVRYVVVRDAAAIPREGLRALLRAAVLYGAV